MREAPKGMIARDILAGAAGPGDWCARQQAHARSAAVMSMVSRLAVPFSSTFIIMQSGSTQWALQSTAQEDSQARVCVCVCGGGCVGAYVTNQLTACLG